MNPIQELISAWLKRKNTHLGCDNDECCCDPGQVRWSHICGECETPDGTAVSDIVAEELKHQRWGGLSGLECGCTIDDLIPCASGPFCDCVPGHQVRVRDPEARDDEYFKYINIVRPGRRSQYKK